MKNILFDIMKRKKSYLFLLFAIFINSMGIALGVKANVGATVWTAAFDNFSQLFQITTGEGTAILSFLIFALSKIIERKVNLKKSIGTLIMCIILSKLIDIDLGFLNTFWLKSFDTLIVKYFFAILGVVLIGAAVAIEIKVDICFLALDDFLNNLRVHVFKGKISKASNVSLLTATLITVITGLLHKGPITNFYTVITFVTLFTFGYIIDFFVKRINVNFDKQSFAGNFRADTN